MPAEDQMTVNERRTYRKWMKVRSQKASRREQSELLTAMEQVAGFQRKPGTQETSQRARTQLQAGSGTSDPGGMGKPGLYVRGTTHPNAFDKRTIGPDQRSDRNADLTRYGSRKQRLPQKGPERANQVRKPVLMMRIPWETCDPGHFEVDVVSHGDESTDGMYVHPLQMIDVAPG